MQRRVFLALQGYTLEATFLVNASDLSVSPDGPRSTEPLLFAERSFA